MKTGTRDIRRIILTVVMAALHLSGSGQESFGDSVVVREGDVGDSVLLREVEVFHKIASGNGASQVISREMIEALPSTGVADALKHFAGVQIKDYGGLGGQKTVNVRSLGSQHVGVYIDGVRVTNAQNGTVDLGKYSLSTLESVSLYNANKTEPLMMASEYASASTIYLQTRRPEKTSIEATGSAGSFGTYKGEILLCAGSTSTSVTPYEEAALQTRSMGKRQAKDRDVRPGVRLQDMLQTPHTACVVTDRNVLAAQKFSGFLNAAFTKSKGNYPFAYHTETEDTTGTRRNSDIRAVRVEGSAFWKDFQLHTYYFDSERGIPGGIVRRLSDLYTDVGREWDRNFFTQVSYKKKIPIYINNVYKELGVRGILKYANDFLHYRSDYPENISVHANNKYRQQDVYAAVAADREVRVQSSEFRVSLSSDLRWSDLRTDVKNFHYVYRLDSKTSLAAFYNWKGIDINAGGLYSAITDYSGGKEKTMERFTWNINASYSPSLYSGSESGGRGLSLRAFYKEVFRAPTLNDLYYTLVGNRNLRPEYTRQFDVGTTYSLHDGGNGPGLDIQTDFYLNKIKDRIVALPLKGSYQWTMLNYGETRCLGVDVSGNIRYKNHSLLISATFQDDRNRTDRRADSYNDFIAYSPRWSVTAVYAFQRGNFSASFSHIFVDKRYWTTENAIEPPLGAYNCTDVKLGYKFPRISIETNFNNIFNQHYEIIQRWPMPKRQFTFTVRYTPCSL